jgi:hypothetical protein
VELDDKLALKASEAINRLSEGQKHEQRNSCGYYLGTTGVVLLGEEGESGGYHQTPGRKSPALLNQRFIKKG